MIPLSRSTENAIWLQAPVPRVVDVQEEALPPWPSQRYIPTERLWLAQMYQPFCSQPLLLFEARGGVPDPVLLNLTQKATVKEPPGEALPPKLALAELFVPLKDSALPVTPL